MAVNVKRIYEPASGDHAVVTLLYGARDEVHNEAVTLQKYLAKQV